MRWLVLPLMFALTACEVGPLVQAPSRGTPPRAETRNEAEVRGRAELAARNFVDVVNTVEPVAESQCQRIAPRMNCDFVILVDDRPGQPPNAFQTIGPDGRPVLAFNLGLIASVENADELAFVMGHESAHHILGHLARTQQNAAVGAVIFSGLAAMSGANPDSVRSAEQFGANVGARSYSKGFELDADELGTIITERAGYNAVRGARFFTRIPDPGNRFLGTHPPNGQRIERVRQTVERMSGV